MNSFRPATESDVPGILPLIARYYAEEGYPFSEQESRAALLDLIGDPRLGKLWTIGDGNRIVGYLAVTLGFSLEFRGRDAFLDELYVLQEHRGHGLGREALSVAERYAEEAGAKALHLEVEPHRRAALELYLEAGYENHARHLMTKRLRSMG